MQNDSISLVDTQSRKVEREISLYKPGRLQAGGEYPYGVAFLGTADGAIQRSTQPHFAMVKWMSFG